MNLQFEQRAALLQTVRTQFVEAIELKKQFMMGDSLEKLVTMADKIVCALAQGGKLMLCGNGGSAADAQHLACELLVRLRSHTNRASIPAMSLALDPSTLTGCANDYGFDTIYERMVEGLGKSGDVLLGLTTSGRSKNVTNALKMAREKGILTLGFLGSGGGESIHQCDFSIVVPSSDPNRVQEVHITAGHILMDLIESLMIDNQYIERRI